MLLVAGFILNLLVKPVNKKFGMTPAELKAEQGALKGTQTNSSVVTSVTNTSMQKDSTTSCLGCSWSTYNFRHS